MTDDVAHPGALDRVGALCRALEHAVEHDAWTGTAWRVRGSTFAHVVEIRAGRPAAYARAFQTDGPATVLTFQCRPEERAALAHAGPPFHLPPWRPGIAGVVLDQHTDWDHVSELLSDSRAICLSPRAQRRPAGRVRPRAPRL
jgi:hypothetical protein